MALLATATTLALTGIGGVIPAPAGAAEDPSLTVEPSTGLHESQDVTVSTTGWTGSAPDPTQGEALRTAFCRAVPEPDLETDCIVGASRNDIPVWSEFEDRVTQVVSGDVVSVPVHRYLPLPSGLHDCRTSPCTLSIVYDGVESERVPLSFGPEWESWPSAAAFVDEVLAPLPLRVIGTDERQDLIDELEDDTTANHEIVTRLAQEPQVDVTVGEATRQYIAFFGRRPDTGGLQYWTDRLAAGLPADQVARHYGASAEARATYAGLSPGEIVDRLYTTALDRSPEPDGRQYWVHALENGLPLWKLIWHVARSAELRSVWADEVLATKIHFGWQGEAPSPTVWVMGGEMYAWIGLNDWNRPPGLP